MTRDMAQRVSMSRKDDAIRQGRVSAARKLIYQKNLQINCSKVEDLLREHSLVPTSVSEIFPFYLHY